MDKEKGKIQQLVHIFLCGGVESCQPRVADKVEPPPTVLEKTKLRCMNSYIIMRLQYH